MLTSITLLDKNFNTNDVDIIVLELYSISLRSETVLSNWRRQFRELSIRTDSG